MKLAEYLGLRGKWPPPARARDNSASLEHGQDIVMRAFIHAPYPSGETCIHISTAFDNRYYVREIEFPDLIAARVFCEFINKHKDRTIDEIGGVDVKFLG